jgi:selenocysteine lyase/cysteine desulfurase
MKRRNFLYQSSLVLGANSLLSATPLPTYTTNSLDTWEAIRGQFLLNNKKVHLSQMLFATHPKPVREAIEKHRKAFDENPVEYVEENLFPATDKVKTAAAEYLQVDKDEIVLTDSTTMGLSLLYHGLLLKEEDEVITSTHAHFSTHKSLDYSIAKNGATLRKISLYEDPAKATITEMVNNITQAISPNTKIIALTWVHSCTGIKTPVRAICDAVQKLNANRPANKRIYVCVDGVHGFGIDAITMEDLGCDFFIAGTHKWLFGPLGTGILWGKKDAWEMVSPTIPAFRLKPYAMWMGYIPKGPIEFSDWITPGGYHAFEHRWALNEAFNFHLTIGKKRIEDRTKQLNTQLKKGLKSIPNLKLHTPHSPDISAGINCFEIEGLSAKETVKKLHKKNIIATASPYRKSYARLTPSIINSETDIERAIEALRGISR